MRQLPQAYALAGEYMDHANYDGNEYVLTPSEIQYDIGLRIREGKLDDQDEFNITHNIRESVPDWTSIDQFGLA